MPQLGMEERKEIKTRLGICIKRAALTVNRRVEKYERRARK